LRVPRKHHVEGKRPIIDYLVCNNLPTMVYTINAGVIDFNPWTSDVHHPTKPDFVVIDLDPSDDSFEKAVGAARATKEVLDEYKIKSFIKTSGRTGIHILLPCSQFDHPQARIIAVRLCDEIHERTSDYTTRETNKSKRGDMLYLDASQNDFADTVASPYSVRPFKLPLVSTPLEWREVRDGLLAEKFTIDNINNRLQKKGDLFLGVLDKAIASQNNKILKTLL
jgi:bifunctional non-homologous end joining protein LigD